MALLNMIEGGGEAVSATSSISNGDISTVLVGILIALFLVGIFWIILELINLIQERRKYYIKLNRRKINDTKN